MSEEASSPQATDTLATLDQSRISRFQLKIMFVSGMGFFTDAYDLFVIGIVVSLAKTEWSMSTSQVSWLNSATLLASAVGALIFGRIADILGRKRIYGYEVLILAAGALASAFAPNFIFLLVCRIILGIGVGGDYPVSATIMSEYSGKQSRGRMVGLVFAMQGAGLIVGPLIASVLLASGLSTDTTWRILLAFGAIPGLAVFYLRRQIHETPRFAMAGGAAEEAQAAIAAATGGQALVPTTQESKARHTQSALEGFAVFFRNRRMLMWLIGTAGAWCLLDFAYYGNSISQPEILKLLNPHASLLQNTLIQLAIFATFAVPGYIIAIALLDKSGRKNIQVLGFALMGVMFLAIGLIPSVTQYAWPFLILYGISYLFTEFGSAHSDAALRWALDEAQTRDGEVTAVYAWQVPFVSIPGAFDRDELEKAAKEFLVDKVSSIAAAPPVPLRPLVSEGDPAESLITACQDASLLVVGTRGRSPFAGLVLGSVSQRCAAAARCPVVLVKAPTED